MADIPGYKTQMEVAQLLGVSEAKIRAAIAALAIAGHTFNVDLRAKYFSEEEIARIRDWLASQ